ncbi:MAG: 16S rRNA (adenine(1518)-N(6)/adenine(1519)-N(6))-dimethyltransferase RsmA [Nitrososphaerota archaeon]|jgi:16S rRNA (adenine1518-N6/adenine1519-N6)-dimethyltransferase|nr:16S rRNA (adenine(1518)-N(6)/adenine(1519)-N(6))-dimethyltransferase RsmA [Nitrososphaerota archaeon]
MSIEETLQLLQTFKITPNELLGQNFMVEPTFYPQLVKYAELSSSDVVLDAGAGFGFLAKFLAVKCHGVIAVEKDPQIAFVLRQQTNSFDNVIVVEDDVLTAKLPVFNKVIAAPPYYLSSKLVLFLLEHNIDCVVLVVQKEFANRLIADVGSENYSWLTVILHQKAQVELLDLVPKDMFYPQPAIDSIIIRIKPWQTPKFVVKNRLFFEQMVKWLFTERNKKLSNALEPFVKNTLKMNKQDFKKIIKNFSYYNLRPREITPEDFGALANVFTN